MKVLLLISTLCLFALAGYGQEKALTHGEFVKLVYAMQKAPATRTVLIEALRKRGVDFEVTPGIRDFLRSKAGNDDELKRALDEAGRRQANPQATVSISAADAADVIERTRKNTLAAVEEMPDFVVKQLIQRSAAYAGTGNYRNLDKLIVAVSYRASGEEEYRLLSLNGLPQADPRAKGSYEEAGGTSSTGEFVTVLATIFKPESETKFDLVDTDLIRDRKTFVFIYNTTREHAQQRITATGTLTESTVTGMRGRIWIDRETSRVLRVENEATDIPAGFPITAAKRVIDYDWTVISDEKYLLPSLSDVRLTTREGARSFETRNVIRFREYQKYGTDVVIRDDDVRDEPDQKKPSN